MKDIITKEQFFAHPINKIWAAITEQDKISQWFINCRFKAEEGFQYALLGDDGTTEKITGEVVKVNPVSELVYTWIVPGTDIATEVKWELAEKDNGTLLTLTHSGISNYPDEQTAVTMMEHFSVGWDKCMAHLEQFSNGEAVERAHGG